MLWPEQTVILLVAGGLALLAFVLRGVYVVFLHPLAKVPGPKLYALTDIPYLYHLVHGQWPWVLDKLHDKYGPVVRFTPNDVSFTTAGAWKQIYSHKTREQQNFEKDMLFYRQTPTGNPNIVVANNEDHRRMRRLLAHAFSEKALRNQEAVIKHYVDLLIAKLAEKACTGSVLDIVRWYNFTTFDLIGDLAFGEPFGCLENDNYHPWVSMIFNGIRSGVCRQGFFRWPRLKPFSSLITPQKMVQSAQEHWQLSEQTAKRRIESKRTDREDFMSYILRHNDERGMTVGEIIENANVLIIAGSETTATQLSGTTFQLLTNRKTYDKLAEEIRTSFQSEEEITMTSVNQLPYLLAVFNEAFRMYPPVPIGLSRVTPEGGEVIEGYWIPEKTCVSVPQLPTYYSRRNWIEPDKFIPERWLGDARFAHDARDTLNPFSLGPRNCIGKNLAYAEMRLILVRLLWNFDLELMPQSRTWNKQEIYTLWLKGSLDVKLTPVTRKMRNGND